MKKALVRCQIQSHYWEANDGIKARLFTLQPPTDVQFGSYAAGLQEHLHDVIGKHVEGFQGLHS